MSTTLIVVLLLQWVGLIALAVILYATVRQVGILHQRVGPAGALQISNAVKVGEKSPEFRLDSMGGGEVTLGAASVDGRSSLVMFVALDCPVCAKLMPAIKAISKKENRWLDVVFASEGDMNRQLEYYRENELEGFPFVLSPELGMTYEVGNLPYGVVLDENGHVASQGLCNTREHIESLLEAKHSGIPTIQDYLDLDFDSEDQSGVINFEKRA